MKTAFLFPGQGAQYPKMAHDLYESSTGVQSLFQMAADTTGIDVCRLLFEGSEEELKETINTQVSVTLANLASALVLKERGVVADGTAGFSLGEYAALVEAGVISAEAVFPLVKLRGELMAKAVAQLDRSAGDPGMAAVLGLSPEQVESVLAESKIVNLFGANYNSPVQVVISGTAAALKEAETVFKAAGAKRLLPLKVAGPFHSPLLKAAGEQLAMALQSIPFANPTKILFSNVTGAVVKTGQEAKELAILQVTAPVRWTAEEKALHAAGFDRVIEAGPGSVLAGLWKALYPENPCLSAGKLEQIQQIV